MMKNSIFYSRFLLEFQSMSIIPNESAKGIHLIIDPDYYRCKYNFHEDTINYVFFPISQFW